MAFQADFRWPASSRLRWRLQNTSWSSTTMWWRRTSLSRYNFILRDATMPVFPGNSIFFPGFSGIFPGKTFLTPLLKKTEVNILGHFTNFLSNKNVWPWHQSLLLPQVQVSCPDLSSIFGFTSPRSHYEIFIHRSTWVLQNIGLSQGLHGSWHI